MGHLLSSVNPEAAERIQPALGRPPLPSVGSVVLYHMRPGHGRQGRTAFPAFVMAQENGRRLSLLVMIDAGDMIDETLVEQYGVGQEHHAWEPIEDGRAVAEGLRGTITALHTRVGELEAEIAALSKIVVGEFDAPKVSIIHIMQDFENRLRDLRLAIDEKSGSARGKSKKK